MGQTCFQPGEAKNTYGTGCFLLMNTGEKPVPSRHGLLTTLATSWERSLPCTRWKAASRLPGRWCSGCATIWVSIEKSSDIEALALHRYRQRRHLLCAGVLGLYAPYWKDNARGVIAGLTRYAGKGHLARAILEATAFQTREVLEAMERDSGIALNSAASRWRHG